MKNKKAAMPSYLIIVLIPLFFLFYSREYSGPAYLADEIGYLTKAAFLGGHVVDGSSSYHGGYSFFLAPVFAIFDSPSVAWSGAMVINALLWFGSFFLLNQLLTIWNSDISGVSRFFALLVSALYPAWVTMSGYVFPTSAFVFIFLCCVITLTKRQTTNALSIVPHSLCVGYLYWIHPTGLSVALASFITIFATDRLEKNYRTIVIHLSLVILLILLYKKGLHAWLSVAMTPDGYSVHEHYPSVSSFYNKITEPHLWVDLTAKLLGQISYITISSFGLALFGLVICFNKGITLFSSRYGNDSHVISTISLFMALSLFFVVCIGAAMFAAEGVTRIDHWIYGRYVDGTVLPVLTVGFLALRQSKIKSVVILVAIMTISGAEYLIEMLNISGPENNLVNTPAFWPQYVIDNVNFPRWIMAGSIGILCVVILGEYAAVPLMIGSFILSSTAQMEWHKNILSGHSKPTSIVDVIRINFSPGTCIGFDEKFSPELSLFQLERYSLYSFYLYNYGYRRITADEWKTNCDGPLLTYNPQQFIGSTSEHMIGKEHASNLFLVVKDSNKQVEIPKSIRSRNDVSYAASRNAHCLLSGCFFIKADELAKFSQVGVIQDNQLSSSGKTGYLFYGPYRKLDKGSYYLIVHGDFFGGDTAVIDIASDRGRKVHYEGKLCNAGCLTREVRVPFELEEQIMDLEIRLHIDDIDQVSIDGYEIVSTEDPPLPRLPALQFFGLSLNVLPRAVGQIKNNAIVSDGRPGYLAFGPYKPIAAGKYKLILHGKCEKSNSPLVDVVSSRGAVQHGIFALKPTVHDKRVLAEEQIQLDAPVEDIEIRVYVGAEDDVTLEGYELVPVETEDHSASREHNPLN
ncbi:hypothetical protein V2P20_04680 [Methylobacter sp. Wu1]|uniref:hypothetical protein n=1 Tax=Methylobacter sp. Wu1 TaxID=3119359 RepID=UPI002F947656